MSDCRVANALHSSGRAFGKPDRAKAGGRRGVGVEGRELSVRFDNPYPGRIGDTGSVVLAGQQTAIGVRVPAANQRERSCAAAAVRGEQRGRINLEAAGGARGDVWRADRLDNMPRLPKQQATRLVWPRGNSSGMDAGNRAGADSGT